MTLDRVVSLLLGVLGVACTTTPAPPKPATGCPPTAEIGASFAPVSMVVRPVRHADLAAPPECGLGEVWIDTVVERVSDAPVEGIESLDVFPARLRCPPPSPAGSCLVVRVPEARVRDVILEGAPFDHFPVPLLVSHRAQVVPCPPRR